MGKAEQTAKDHGNQPADPVPDKVLPAQPAQEPAIAAELTGMLRCVSCRYDLRGLSIRVRCPECGLPVQVTVLSVIDPDAAEIQPIRFPRLTALGLLVWAGGSTITMLLAWVLAIAGFAGGLLSTTGEERLVRAGAVVLGLAGAGAIAIIAPQRGIGRWQRIGTACGVLGYGLLVRLWLALAPLAALNPDDTLLQAWTGSAQAAPWRPERLLAWLCMAAIVWLLRWNLRVLVARSLLLRSAKVDRQTMLALVVVLLIAAAGDGIGLIGPLLKSQMRGIAVLLGEALVGGGAVLFSIGLLGVLLDTIRLLPAVLKPPLRMGDLVGNTTRETR